MIPENVATKVAGVVLEALNTALVYYDQRGSINAFEDHSRLQARRGEISSALAVWAKDGLSLGEIVDPYRHPGIRECLEKYDMAKVMEYGYAWHRDVEIVVVASRGLHHVLMMGPLPDHKWGQWREI